MTKRGSAEMDSLKVAPRGVNRAGCLLGGEIHKEAAGAVIWLTRDKRHVAGWALGC